MEASLTNYVVRVDVVDEGVVPSSALLRWYGEPGGLFRREDDLWNYRLVHSVGLAPKLLKTFEGGRLEEFLQDFAALKARDVRDPIIARCIAEHLARFHFMTSGQLYEEKEEAAEKLTTVWDRCRQWLDLAWSTHPQLTRKLGISPTLPHMWDVEKSPASFRGHLCFCHFDLQPGNILMDMRGEKMHLIDYEYACLGFIELDIANHWCEWCSDYCSPTPHILQTANFPSLHQQRQFIRHYLSTMAQIVRHPPPMCQSFLDVSVTEETSKGFKTRDVHSLPFSWKWMLCIGEEISESIVEEMRKRVLQYVPLSHFMWSLWSIVQAANAEFDFDFAAFAEQRLSLYRLWTKNG